MSNEFKFIKETKKANFYENDEYKVKVKEGGYAHPPKNSPYCDVEEEGLSYFVELTITNKSTGKSSSKRCFQGFNVIKDVQQDINNKSQFSDMFKKIDN